MTYWHLWLMLAPIGLVAGVAVPLAIYVIDRRMRR